MSKILTAMFVAAALTVANSSAWAVCPSFTSFSNGQTADADQVMANFNYILQCPVFTGSVGIGGSSTTSIFYVEDDRNAQTGALVHNSTSGTAAAAYLGVEGDVAATFLYSTSSTFVPSGVFAPNEGVLRSATTASGGLAVGTGTSAPLYLFTSNATHLTVSATGYVGINTTSPGYPLYVNGTAYATGAAGALSDRRHKTDIQPLSANALDLVGQLKPVTFLWKRPADEGMKGRQIGFIAQDVLPVLPEIVLTENNAEKTLGLKYDSFIPVLTKAIQEQQAEISELKTKNNELSEVTQQLQRRLSKLENAVRTRTAQK